jgi:hypothetical protein
MSPIISITGGSFVFSQFLSQKELTLLKHEVASAHPSTNGFACPWCLDLFSVHSFKILSFRMHPFKAGSMQCGVNVNAWNGTGIMPVPSHALTE